jgi:hypothetical protein
VKAESYYMLVEDGDIFHVNVENKMGKINEHFVISKINDYEMH